LHSEFQHKQAIEIYRNSENKDAVLRAWAVFVLSHQSFYSIFCNTWKCSKQRNIAKQFHNKKEQFNELYVKRLETTSIFCRDAIDVIKNADAAGTFHYIDPPYYNSDCGHYDGYSKGNFEDLLTAISNVKGKFMLSSYPSEILSEYSKRYNWNTIEFDVARGAGSGRKTEVLTLNYNLGA
jgi:DNA adenine methylase